MLFQWSPMFPSSSPIACPSRDVETGLLYGSPNGSSGNTLISSIPHTILDGVAVTPVVSASPPKSEGYRNVYVRSHSTVQTAHAQKKPGFIENLKKRTRQRSINIPMTPDLDPFQDIGSPPISHDPPPEVYSHLGRSAPDGGFSSLSRRRSNSETQPMNGGMVTPRRQSGVLVFFPQSTARSSMDDVRSPSASSIPSSLMHSPPSSGRLQSSTTSSQMTPTSRRMTPRLGNDRETRSFEGHLPGVNSLFSSSSSNSSSSSDAQSMQLTAGPSHTPHKAKCTRHPLYVDTSLANEQTSGGEKCRASPISQMVDAVGRRIRTSSLSCRSSACDSETRGSISMDNYLVSPRSSVVRSGGGRPPQYRYSRVGQQNSLDSGLDLSSPVAGTALLIKDCHSGEDRPMMTISSAATAPPRVSSPARTSDSPGSAVKKEKKGLLSTAKAKAQGSLRKALYGKSKKKTRDAEDMREEDEEDYSTTNYDTVRSLPASGHYGNRRRPQPLRVSIEEMDHSSSSSPPFRAHTSAHYSLPVSSPAPCPSLLSTVVIRLPRRGGRGGGSVPISRLSPLGVTACGRLSRTVPAAPTDPDPAFDFAAWHSNLDLINNQDSIYSLFMKAHKCYDLIPLSTKLVVFDTHLPVRKAFFALVYNGVRAAPLWDAEKNSFVGMLTITDFIKILYRHHSAGDDAEKMAALEEQKIEAWREKFKEDDTLRPLVCIDPNESLYRAVEMLCESHVHRLPVMERATGNISYILTHKRIIKFLSLYMHDLPKPAFMDETPKSLGIGSWGDVLTIHVDTPLIDALKIFLENRVSALPLVDQDGKAVDIYAKFDVISLAADKAYDKLDITVHEALKHRQEWFEGVRTCRETDSLFSVLESIVRAEVHRLIVTDENNKVTGIISLSDILKYLVLDRCAPVSSTSLTMERVDEQMIDSSPMPSSDIVNTPVFELPETEFT